MTRFHSIAASAVVAGLLAAGAASAQGLRGGPGGPDRPGRGPGGAGAGPALALRALDLTDAQRQQIREINEQERTEMRQLNERLRQAVETQRAAIQAIPVNEGLIRQTTDALADVQAEAAIRRAHLYNQVWAVLTPAQQAQATKLRAERAAGGDQRREQRQERRRNRLPNRL
jgi:Spy/CpxP family protein refolding chaperone